METKTFPRIVDRKIKGDRVYLGFCNSNDAQTAVQMLVKGDNDPCSPAYRTAKAYIDHCMTDGGRSWISCNAGNPNLPEPENIEG